MTSSDTLVRIYLCEGFGSVYVWIESPGKAGVFRGPELVERHGNSDEAASAGARVASNLSVRHFSP